MKKLMLICSVTFMFVMLGTSAQAQLNGKDAFLTIESYLETPQPTKAVVYQQLDAELGQVGNSATVFVKERSVERALFKQLMEQLLITPSAKKSIDIVVARATVDNAKPSVAKFRIKAEELLNL